MTARKLSAVETEALLTSLFERATCSNGCDCISCRIFDMGVESGRRDAVLEFQAALDNLKRGLSA